MKKIFFLFLAFFVLTQTAYSLNYVVNPFEEDFQGFAPWCWASSASMVLSQHGIKKKTCQVVSETLDLNCCALFASNRCWVGGSPSKILAKYRLNYQWTLNSTIERKPSSVQVLQNLVNVLRRNKLAILHFKNTDHRSTDHIVVARAALNVENLANVKIVIYDPSTGEQTLPGNILLSGYYDSGSDRYWWDGSWLPR